MIVSETNIDPSILDETQCYICHSVLTKPQTYMLIESETALRRETDDCGGICFGCLKKADEELHKGRILL